MLSLARTSPIAAANPDPNPTEIGGNDLFQQINDIIKRGIDRQITNDSLEVGDKIKSDDGNFRISIKEFTSSNRFPVRFRPRDKEVLEDKTIVPIVSDFNGSSEYIIKRTSSSEESVEVNPSESSSKKPKTSDQTTSPSSTTEASSSTTAASSTTSTAAASSTTNKN